MRQRSLPVARIEASRLLTLRQARGFSQRSLSEQAGITRQAVGAIETGRMQPSVGIALGLARALGTTVEELFGSVAAPTPAAERVATASIAGHAVRHPLLAEHLAIEPSQSDVPTVFVAGCDLAVGLLAGHATVRTRDIRALWLPMTNRAALQALIKGTVHAAVVHQTALRRSFGRDEFTRFELATTEQGWLLAPGNPLDFRNASDLSKKKARLVNRPAGAGARRLLDAELRRSHVDPRRLPGYERELPGQLDVGRAIAHGFADAGIGIASVARSFGLEFLPLSLEQCTLVVPRVTLRTPEVRALLDALRSSAYRNDLEALQSYDAARTGEQLG